MDYGMTDQLAVAYMMGTFAMIWLASLLICYVYFGLTLMLIANKTKTTDSWWAWVPILNLLLFFKIAKKPLWWILLMLIPLVNLIIMIITWMEISKVRGKPEWVGLLTIIPIVGFFIPAYLAFAD